MWAKVWICKSVKSVEIWIRLGQIVILALWAFTMYETMKKNILFCYTQLNSTQSWVSLIFLRNHKPHHTTKPTPTFSQLLHNQTRPNSVCNLVSTQLEDSCKKVGVSWPPTTFLQFQSSWKSGLTFFWTQNNNQFCSTPTKFNTKQNNPIWLWHCSG